MPRNPVALLAVSLLAVASAALPKSVSAPYIDLTGNFTRFVDETAGMEDAARVALFRKQMDTLLPGFYTPRNGTDSLRYDAHVAKLLMKFPELRSRYERVQKNFPAAFAAGIEHFRTVFPRWNSNLPVYLLHSLGEMDGGTRTLNGKAYLIFGADVIAQIHDTRTLTPFLDHELFHVENGKYFAECEQVWCALWTEGLATYAAKVMNPGADDDQLLLTSPKPIRAATDARWPAALCFTRAKLLSSDETDVEALFVGSDEIREFPARFGYYMGLRAIEELDGRYKLPELAKMPADRAQTALTGALDSLIRKAGGCRSGAAIPLPERRPAEF
jgi:hypothetical protein